jgi:hypothetical protein
LLFCQVLFRLPFSNSSFLFLPALHSSLAPGLRAPPGLPGPQHLILTQVRHLLMPATPLPPLWEAPQVRGVRPLHLQITAPRRNSLSSQRPKIPAPATWAPEKNLPGGRNLRFLPSLKRRKRRRLPPRPRRKLPCRQPLHPRRRRKPLFLRQLGPRQRLHQPKDLPRLRPSHRLRPSRSPTISSRGRPAERPRMAAPQAARSL